MDYQLYQLDDCLTSGGQRMDLKLAYKQYGKLSAAKDNAIFIASFLSIIVNTLAGSVFAIPLSI